MADWYDSLPLAPAPAAGNAVAQAGATSTPTATAAAAPSTPATPAGLVGGTINYDPGDGNGPRTGTIAGVGKIGSFVLNDGSIVGPNLVSKVTPATPDQPKATSAPASDSEWYKALPVAPVPAAVDQVAATKSTQPSIGSLTANVGAGFNANLASTLGAPVDTLAAAMRNGPTGQLPAPPPQFQQQHPEAAAFVNNLRAALQNPLGGASSVKSALGLVGANPDSVPAPSGGDQAARAMGSGVASMILPFGAARAAAGAGATGPLVDMVGTGSLGGNAAVGAGAGLGGYAGQAMAPAPFKPLGNFAGQMAGGGIAGAGTALGKAIGSGVGDLFGRWTAPMGFGAQQPLGTAADGQTALTATQAQQRLAGQRIAGAATNVGKLPGALDVPAAESQIVPGSQPTTAQLSADPGLAQLERTQQTKNPAPFLTRRADQNAARVQSLHGIAPDADPAALGQFVRQQLDAINAHGDQAVQEAQQTAQQARTALGGEGSPQDYGQAIRAHLTDAQAAAKGHESALWNAIDPDGKLVIDAQPTIQAAHRIAQGLGEFARPAEGEEKAIIGKTQMAKPAMAFKDFSDLRGRLLAAIRQERVTNGNTPALARMQQLRQAMDDNIAEAAQVAAERDERNVRAGAMHRGNTVSARLKKVFQGEYPSPDAGRSENTVRAGRAGGSGAEPLPDHGPGLAAAPGGKGVAQGGRPGTSAGSPRLPSKAPSKAIKPGSASDRNVDLDLSTPDGGFTALDDAYKAAAAPNFDVGAASRYRNAADATRERVATFNSGATGQALKQGPTAGSFRVPDSQVAAKFFNAGKHPAEDLESFTRAVGGRQDAVDGLQDYAASELRRVAEKDGVLNARLANAWISKHEEALSAFPELAERFRDAASAQETVNDLSAARVRAIRDQQHYAAQKILGSDPVQAVHAVLGKPDEMAKIVRWAGLDRSGQAMAGLRSATLEDMRRTVESTEPAGETGTNMLKGAVLANYLSKNRAALTWVFGPKGVKTMRAVADDIARSNPAKGKLPASPGTAQDLAGVAKHASASGEGHGDNLMSYLVAMAVEHHTGSLVTSFGGAIGVKMANAFRSKGLKTVDDLVTEAMLNPDLAVTLLAKAKPAQRPAMFSRLASQLGTLSLAGATKTAAQ